MALLFYPQGPTAPTAPAVSAGDLAGQVYALLGAAEAADLYFWTDAEITAWQNEGLARLARRVALFVDRGTVAVTAGTATYALPTDHLSTLHVSLAAVRLRAANVAEVEALSSTWRADSGTPSRYLQDHGAGLASIRLYKKPVANATAYVIEHELPATVTADDPLPAPEPLMDYLLFFALGEARRKESDAAMPEIAAHCDAMLDLYEGILKGYWGVPQ